MTRSVVYKGVEINLLTGSSAYETVDHLIEFSYNVITG